MPDSSTDPETSERHGGDVETRSRARDLQISPGEGVPGPINAITDVPGVLVGHTTVTHGGLRTGVTAILPHERDLYRDKVRAAVVVGNGFGKLIGGSQLDELGELETPILLTGTLSAFRAADALVTFVLNSPGHGDVTSVNPVVGETNDGYLSDGRSRPITDRHVIDAIERATSGSVPEGCVGAGTGTICFGWKGGIGTSSRTVTLSTGVCTVGALVQTNFGGSLRVLGAPIGQRLLAPRRDTVDGSCMIVVGTDAALDARQLGRVARRAVSALARVGSAYSHGSGDYAIAFSTELTSSRKGVSDYELTPIFSDTIDAVEEAVLNSLFMATTTYGRDGRVAEALPLVPLIDLCRDHGIPAIYPAV